MPAMNFTNTRIALTSSPACAQRMLRRVALFTSAADLEVRSLQLVGRFVDARGVRFRVLTRQSLRNDEARIFRLVREGCVDEEVSAARDYRALESLYGGHQVVELGTRFAAGEQHALLREPAGVLQRGPVALFAPVRVKILLLLLVGLLSHQASVISGYPSHLQVP